MSTNQKLSAVEKLFFQRNVTTAISVGQARGVMLLALAQVGLEVFEYTPNESQAGGSGLWFGRQTSDAGDGACAIGIGRNSQTR